GKFCYFLLRDTCLVQLKHLSLKTTYLNLDLRRLQGQVYHKPYAKTTFARECLGAYCQYLYNGQPLFRTVGNDSTFYRPPTPNQLRNYLKQLPEDFEMCFKVWEELTIPTYAKQPRYGLNSTERAIPRCSDIHRPRIDAISRSKV